MIGPMRRVVAFNKNEIAAGRGLSLAANLGHISGGVSELNPNDPASYRQRAAQAAQANKAFGVSGISAMLPQEISRLNDDIMGVGPNQSSPEQLLSQLTAMGKGLGREVTEGTAAEALDKSGASAMVITNSQTQPTVALNTIKGMRIRQSTDDFNPTSVEQEAAANNVLKNTFAGDTAVVRQTVVDGANALYAYRASLTGSSEFDETLYEQALTDTLGGVLTSGNQSIATPVPGMQQGQFNDLVTSLSRDADAMLKYSVTGAAPVFQGGAAFDPSVLDKGFFSLGTDAELRSTGPGRYGVWYPGSGFVNNANGGLYQIDLRAYHESGDAEATPIHKTVADFDKDHFEQLRDRARASIQEPAFDELGDVEIPAPEQQAAPEQAAPEQEARVEIEQIQKDEGFRAATYTDSRGHLTAGFGHKLTDAEKKKYPLGTKIPKDQIDAWFKVDHMRAELAAHDAAPGVPAQVHDILTNMAFNVGRGGLQGFKGMLKAVKAGDYNKAAAEMEWIRPNNHKLGKTAWFKQTGDRAKRLVARMKAI